MCLNSAGEAYVARFWAAQRIGDLDRGLELRRQALFLLTRVPRDSLEFGDVLSNLARDFLDRYGQTNDIRHLKEYEELVGQLHPSHMRYATHITNLGIAYGTRYLGTRAIADLDEAIRYFKEALARSPAQSQMPALNNLFSRYEATGEIADLQEAIRFFERSIAEKPAQSLPTPRGRSWLDSLLGKSTDPKVDGESPQNRSCRTLSNLGTALIARYSHIGNPADLEQAIQTLEQAVDQSPPGSSELAARLATLGDALRLRYGRTQARGDLDAAIQKFDLAVTDAQRGSPDLPSVLISRGIGLIDRYEVAHNVDDLKSAIGDFRRALDKMPAGSPDRPVLLNSLGTGLSKLYGRIGDMADLDEAIRSFDEAVKLAKQRSSKTPDIANNLNNLSNALAFRYERTGTRADLETAIQYSKDVIAETDPGSPMLPSFLANLGSRLSSLYNETNDPADLTATIDTWEQGLRILRTSYVTASVSFKVGGERTWPTLYANLAGAYLARMDVEPAKAQSSLRRAIEVAEESKSYLLAEQFSRADMPIPADISAEQADREKQLLTELTRLDAVELAAYGQLEAKQQGAGGLQRLQQREQCRQELQRIWTLMEQSGPQAADYVALRRGDAPIWDDLVRLTAEMGTDTALLSLFTARDNTVIFVIRKGQDPHWIDGKISSAAWHDVWSKLVQEVHNYDRKRASEESWDRPLRLLLEKTYAELASIKRVILAPHALGHLIPWSAAISHLGLRGANENPLPVVTIPTLKLAAGLRPLSSSRKNGTLVVGNPGGDLKFAEDEARAVARKLRTEPIIGRNATKQAVLKILTEASVVHLATHAYLSERSPLDSGVVLADGVLTAREVIQHRLRTDLLVLSACETGLGASLGGDELAGLSRAFMYAGARSMLVSLWKVNDMATAALMAAFYDAYCGGADKAEALSQAMAKVRSDTRWEHSYYWGSFTLIGRWD